MKRLSVYNEGDYVLNCTFVSYVNINSVLLTGVCYLRIEKKYSIGDIEKVYG